MDASKAGQNSPNRAESIHGSVGKIDTYTYVLKVKCRSPKLNIMVGPQHPTWRRLRPEIPNLSSPAQK
jgi:hypothetical protein